MTGGQLDERGTELTTDPLRFGHQPPPDAALACTRVDDESEDAEDPVVVLEAGQCVDGDEAEERAIVLGDDDTCLWRVEAFEPGDDVARAGGIALVSEHRGDRLGVV